MISKYSVSKVVVECNGWWHKLRIEALPDGKFAAYNYDFGAVPYFGTSQDEVIRQYIKHNPVGLPIGSINI